MAQNQIIPVTGLHTVGMIQDSPAVSLPPNAFTNVVNMRLKGGAARKISGEYDLLPISYSTTDPDIFDVDGEYVYGTWWANPNIGPDDGYFVVARTESQVDKLYAIKASDGSSQFLGVEVPSGGKWQSTVFQGGYAIVLNNGISKPVYVLDNTGNTDINALEAYELPGWDSYYTVEEKVNDVFDSALHLPEFDIGDNVDFTTSEVLMDVYDSDGVRKFGETLDGLGTEKQFTISFDSGTNTHLVTVAIAAGGVGQDAFTEFLESGDQLIVRTRSTNIVQVRAGVIRAWGDTLVAGNLREIIAPLAESFTTTSITWPAGTLVPVEVGDKLFVTSPEKRLVTITDVTGTTASWDAPDALSLSSGTIKYTVVESGTAVRNQPGVVRISDVASAGSIPNNWNPYSTGVSTAEEFQLSSTGEIKDMADLQGNLVIYSDRSIHTISRTNSPLAPYISSVVSESYGALSIDCVKNFNGIHIVVGSNDIYQFSGHPASIKSISTDRVKSTFFDRLSIANQENTQILLNKAQDEIWVCYTDGLDSNDDIDSVLIWNYHYNVWYRRNITNFTAIFPAPTIEGAYDSVTTSNNVIDPSILRPVMVTTRHIFGADFESTYTDRTGANYESYVERKQAAITPEFDTESVTSIAVWAESNAVDKPTIRLRFRNTDNPNEVESPQLSEGQTGPKNAPFIIGETYKSDIRLNGRFLSYRITDENNTDKDWNISGIQIEISKGGRR